MMIKRFLLTTIFLFGVGQLGAGVVFEVEVKDHTGGREPSTTQVMAEGKNLKMDITEQRGRQDGDVIFRGDRREMVVVDHNSKSYMVMDQESISAIAGQVSSALSQVQEALKNVPENQRAMMEKMMKDRMPKMDTPKGPNIQVKKQGQKKKINGYPCVRYDVIKDGQKSQELWVTDWGNVEGGSEARDAFMAMGEFFEDLMASISKLGGPAGGLSSMSDNMFAQIKALNGFPVLTREFGEDGSLEEEATLRSAKRRTLDPADFEPPSGYKRRSMGPQ